MGPILEGTTRDAGTRDVGWGSGCSFLKRLEVDKIN